MWWSCRRWGGLCVLVTVYVELQRRLQCCDAVVYFIKNLSIHPSARWLVGWTGAFVRVWLLCAGEKLASRRTTTQPNTSSPRFNEEFQFELKSRDLMTSTCLVLSVVDEADGSRCLGAVKVGGTETAEGSSHHWDRMMSRPGRPVEQWHSLHRTKWYRTAGKSSFRWETARRSELSPKRLKAAKALVNIFTSHILNPITPTVAIWDR